MKKISLIKIALFALLGCMVLLSCKKNSSSSAGNPQSNGVAPDSAAGGNVLTLTGTGLADMRSIIFDQDSVPASFNPVFNTDNALIFRVPDTASGGPQHIIFTNSAGKSISVPFRVIALPTISAVAFPGPDFITGTKITLTGNNLDDVSKVVLTGTTSEATIVSQTKKQLVIAMPATTLSRAKLDITNSSGTITTNQEFVSVDNAYKIFAGDFGTGVENWSWSAASVYTGNSVVSTKSLQSIYSSGSWAAVSIHFDVTVDASKYTYLTYWIKGGTIDTQIDVNSENGGSTITITVPAKVWTYFKYPVSGYITGFQMERLDFKMHGPDGGDQTVYFDDILLVK